MTNVVYFIKVSQLYIFKLNIISIRNKECAGRTFSNI